MKADSLLPIVGWWEKSSPCSTCQNHRIERYIHPGPFGIEDLSIAEKLLLQKFIDPGGEAWRKLAAISPWSRMHAAMWSLWRECGPVAWLIV